MAQNRSGFHITTSHVDHYNALVQNVYFCVQSQSLYKILAKS